MLPNVSQSPESRPEQPNEPGDFDCRIASIRHQIADLQRDLAQIKERLDHLKRQQALQAPAARSVPANVQVDHPLKDSGDRSNRPFSQRGEYILLGLLVLLAFVIRVYQLGSFPDTVLADEADNVQDSIHILYGSPPANGFFGLDWTNQPAFSAYKEAAFIAIFGFNIFALRLSSAVISTLALIPFYLLLRRQISIVASLLATILFATNVWYLNFSRSGWNCSDIGFYMLMAMLFLVWGLNAMTSENTQHWKTWAHFAAAGFFCALGLYGYPAGRAITLAVVAFFPVAWLFYRRHSKTLLVGYLVLFGMEAATFAPEGIYIAKDWDHFNGRSNVVIIFNDPAYQADPVRTMWNQFYSNIRGPWDGRVNNTPQYSPVGEPQLDRITGLLTLVGMALTFFMRMLRKRSETWLWWLMLLAGWGSTQLFTVNTPNGARGIGYMPTLIYFAGVGLEGIVFLLNRISERAGKSSILKQVSFAVLIGVIVLAGYANVKHYIDWQNAPPTRGARYLYVTTQEFSEWSAAIIDRAKNHLGVLNVGEWRELYPIENVGNPYGASQ